MLSVEGKTKRFENGAQFDLKREREGFSTRFRILDKAVEVEDFKRVEDQHRRNEGELLRITDAIPLPIVVFATDGNVLYGNESLLEYVGLSLAEFQSGDSGALHSDDMWRIRGERRMGFAGGEPFQSENRMRGKDGRYRWFHFHNRPLRDEQGRVICWYATGTDIEDRKQIEEGVQNENLILHKKIDRSPVFQEIIGSSGPLRNILSHVVHWEL